MSEPMVIRLLVEQRKRLVAAILGHAERTFWPRLSREEQEEFRAKVLSSVGSYSDLMRDLVKITDEDALRNERALDLIEAVHTSQRAIADRLGPDARKVG